MTVIMTRHVIKGLHFISRIVSNYTCIYRFELIDIFFQGQRIVIESYEMSLVKRDFFSSKWQGFLHFSCLKTVVCLILIWNSSTVKENRKKCQMS